MSFTAKLLNQAGALVHVYTDGSVLVTHGAAEMGQGIHTKIIQIAAQALGVPVEHVHIAETSTDKVPNSSPTAASVQSDINGAAVLNACEQINERLRPLRETNPGKSWKEVRPLSPLHECSGAGRIGALDISHPWSDDGDRCRNQDCPCLILLAPVTSTIAHLYVCVCMCMSLRVGVAGDAGVRVAHQSLRERLLHHTRSAGLQL